MTPRLFFEITRIGLKIDKKYIVPLETFGPRINRVDIKKIADVDDLLILVASRMQL
jgi:hypothetical protein